MPEIQGPSMEGVGVDRKGYEKWMKPGIVEHLVDKLKGDTPPSESREEAMIKKTREEADEENRARDSLKRIESSSLKELALDTGEERQEAISNARANVERIANRNVK